MSESVSIRVTFGHNDAPRKPVRSKPIDPTQIRKKQCHWRSARQNPRKEALDGLAHIVHAKFVHVVQNRFPSRATCVSSRWWGGGGKNLAIYARNAGVLATTSRHFTG